MVLNWLRERLAILFYNLAWKMDDKQTNDLIFEDGYGVCCDCDNRMPDEPLYCR